MNAERIQRAWDAIGDCTPMKSDCGALCGAACCRPDGDGQGGVCLLPGEVELLGAAPWCAVAHEARMDAPMILCQGPCERSLRPFLCRVFPLCPALGRDGRWTVRMDARARAVCPLARAGLRGLDPDFVRGAVRAVRILAGDAQIEAFLRRWSEIEAEFRRPLF